MAFITTSIFSQVLKQRVPVDLFIPTDRKDGDLRQPRAVIYFLHGMHNSQTDFREYTAANRYAMENHVAMVYVNAPYSFYTDMKYGFKYYTYITEELPKILHEIFRLPDKREKNFIAGLSMGGYGALMIGLSRPDLYGACAGLSAPCDIGAMLEYAKTDPVSADILVPAFGESLELEDRYNLFKLAEKHAKLPAEQQIRILQCVGKQDDSYAIGMQNQTFRQYAEGLGLANYKYMEWDGKHDNSFWDRGFLHAISFFLKNRYDEKKLQLWRSEAE